MKRTIVAALLALMPATLFADATATCITVFDAGTFRAMTATNAIGQVADGDLFAKSLVRGCYFGGKDADNVAVDFTWDKKPYRLLIGKGGTKTIYTVLLVRANLPPEVVAVGEILRGTEAKADARGDPFVVVVRSGNYIEQ